MSSQAERALAAFPAGNSNGEFALPPELLVVMARGEGCRLWDTDGHEYLDFSLGRRLTVRPVSLRQGFARHSHA